MYTCTHSFAYTYIDVFIRSIAALGSEVCQYYVLAASGTRSRNRRLSLSRERPLLLLAEGSLKLEKQVVFERIHPEACGPMTLMYADYLGLRF